MVSMKKKWSTSWISSIQPRKQRKFRHNAPLHARKRFVSIHLSPELRKRFSKRSIQARKGDEIKIMRGSMRGKLGTVERVDLSKSRIYIEDIKRKKVDGSEVPLGFQPSNLMITRLKLDDKRRQAVLDRVSETGKPRKPAAESPVPKQEKPAEPAVKGPEKKPSQKTKPRKSARKPAEKRTRKK
jgi:large subunit ribosomal protein L24